MSTSIFDHMQSNGYSFDPVFDGEIHRFKMPGRADKSGWFVGHQLQISPKKDCFVMVYGDFAQNETIEWKSMGRFSESEKIKRDQEVRKLKLKIEKERKARQEEAAKIAKKDWDSATLINGKLPPYFEKKKLNRNFDLRTKEESVLIPVYTDFEGEITSYQTIDPDGEKLFVKDGAIKGNFHYIKGNSKKVLICEGFATGASLFEATGYTVVVAFYASNLMPVCEKLLKKYSADTLLVCADNDHRRGNNVGIKAAELISQKLGIKFIYPKFDPDSRSTDFNDLMMEKGRSAVFAYFEEDKAKQSPLHGVTFDDKGKPHNNIDNVLKVLENNFCGQIWQDDFAKRIFTNIGGAKKEWSDIDDLSMTVEFQSQFGFKTIHHDLVSKGCVLFAAKNVRNEPKEYLESLKWDGEGRIQGFFFNALGSDPSVYAQAASKNFWISLVARILNPGCKVDNMVILEGGQGKLKSTALRLIAGDDLFAEVSQDPTSKDFFSALAGKSLIEISELESFSKADALAIKRVVSCQVDRYRVSYDKYSKDHPRQCIFVGTTNDSEYLKDTTGNRRFWPINISKIDLDYIRKNRDQLYAEAVHCFKTGSKWWEMPEDETKEIVETKVQIDIWHHKIEDYCLGRIDVTTPEVVTACLKLEINKTDNIVARRVGAVLRTLGYRNVTVRVENKVRRVWRKYQDSDKK